MSAEQSLKGIVLEALRKVIEPRSGKDVVTLGFVREVSASAGRVSIPVQLPPELATDEMRAFLQEQILSAVTGIVGVDDVRVEFQVIKRQMPESLAGVKHVIAIGAGKGGVGKSTVAVLVAVGLMRRGLRVGLLDADVYGPSLPKLTGTEEAAPLLNERGWVVPVEFEGIKILSMGYMVPPDQAVIWRGPMAQSYVKELLQRGDWGELDYLIVDLPPGTGDIPLTLAQTLPLTGAVLVCTPQEVALLDVVKALRMYEKLGVPTIGFVENMSYYLLPDGQRDYIFGQGGVERATKALNVPYLGGLPLHGAIREYCDAGQPLALYTEVPAHFRQATEEVVSAMVGQVTTRERQRVPLPQLKISN
ncbi:MAG: Mrp/NBP35 family ATP-binding protein [Planctomycetota bacterium]